MAAIVASDIVWRLTTTAGAAGGSTAQANPNASLGKYASTTAWAGGVANDLFDDISGAENAASTVDYRALAIHNTNGANAYQNVVAYLSSEVAGGASVSIASDNIAASAYTSASAQLAQIALETTAPTGVSAFSAPTTAGSGISLGTIGTAQVKGLWVRRTAANTAALSNDGVTLAVQGDTGSL